MKSFAVFAFLWALSAIFDLIPRASWLDSPAHMLLAASAVVVVLQPTSLLAFGIFNLLRLTAFLVDSPATPNHQVLFALGSASILWTGAVLAWKHRGGPSTVAPFLFGRGVATRLRPGAAGRTRIALRLRRPPQAQLGLLRPFGFLCNPDFFAADARRLEILDSRRRSQSTLDYSGKPRHRSLGPSLTLHPSYPRVGGGAWLRISRLSRAGILSLFNGRPWTLLALPSRRCTSKPPSRGSKPGAWAIAGEAA